MTKNNTGNLPLFDNLSIPGVGIDIVLVSRFADKLDNHQFLERVYNKSELEDVGEGAQRLARLAVRWAAKEAVSKALGCGISDKLNFKDVEILKNKKGKPLVRLSPSAMKEHNYPTFNISLSHDGDYAVAIVITGNSLQADK